MAEINFICSSKLFLINDKISTNIAFSQSIKNSNLQKIYNAAETACAAEFINVLPNRYDTLVGRMVFQAKVKSKESRLQEPCTKTQVIIFDEVTSSLDEITEKK